MVKRNPAGLAIWRTIKNSFSRYLAILAIIALGAGVFSGLRVSSDAMIRTGDAYYRSLCFSDFAVMSTLGFTDEDVAAALAVDGIVYAEGAVSTDLMIVDPKGDSSVLKVHSLMEQINQLNLIAGRMPENGSECVLDARSFDRSYLGKAISISPDNEEDTLEMMAYETYTVVGLANSPYYLNNERGTTTLGDGRVAGFAYFDADGFCTDYYTDLYVSLGEDTPEIYSDEYEALVESVEPALRASLEARAPARYEELRRTAEEEIADGETQLAEGWEELEIQSADGQRELDDAKQALEDARSELDSGWSDYESGRQTLQRQTASGSQELEQGQRELEEARAALEGGEQAYQSGKAELEAGEAAYADGLADYEAGLAAFQPGYEEYEAGKKQYEDGEAAYAEGAAQLADGKAVLDDSKAQLDSTKVQLDEAEAMYAALAAFYLRADECRNAVNAQGYAFGSNQALADSLTAAATLLNSDQNRSAQTIYQLSQRVLPAFGLTPESLVASADQISTVRKGLILAAIDLAGASYGVRYSSFDAYRQDLESAIAFINSEECQSSMQLYDAANSALGGYVSDYDQSTGVQGFLTDWNYYAAVQSGMAAQLGCASDLASIRTALNASAAAYEDGLAQYEDGLAAYQENEALLKESRAELDAAKKELDDAWVQLEPVKAQLDEAKIALDEAAEELQSGRKTLESSRAELDQGWQDYEAGIQTLSDGRNRLSRETQDAEKQLADARLSLEDGEQSYADGLTEYDDGVTEFETKIADAKATLEENEQKLADAKEALAALKPATIYVLDRSSNIGYVCFENDAMIIEGVSRVFPVFFFLVAALVCITTMTRMVEDDRSQIGIMKALGYGSFAISKKYLIYAGSASLLGCIIGLFGGMWLIPKVLWQAYSILYNFGDILFFFDLTLASLCTLGYLACAIGATWFSCRSSLREVPAELIRPKSPKPGKRVLLERIPFLWKRLNFLRKVSLRNVFRYKKRLFMMLLGIGGCTGLLLTGFGIRDSIQNFANYQFGDIALYDAVVTFDEPMDDTNQSAFLEQCGSAVEDAVFFHMSSVDVRGDSYFSSASLITVEDSLDGFMDFHTGSEPLNIPAAGSCLVSKGLSERFGYQVGETISFSDADLHAQSLTIAGVFDNYVGNYIITVPESMTEWEGASEVKTAYVNYREGADPAAATAVTAAADYVINVQDTASQQDRVNAMMSSLDYIVALVVFCAGALAFIVLYNLTNINITERVREIATLKVLGFYAGETASYVFRENMILSVLGALFGLPVGKLLHSYVMHQIHVDGICFDIRILVLSYLIAVALTLVFTGIVNSVMYFKIKRVDMTESLKSVE